MNALESYLIKQTSLMIAIVMMSLGGLLIVTGIADEAARKVNENYTLLHAVMYKLHTLPSMLHEYIGVIVMLGTLITVASLNKHQELTIIQLSSNSALSLTTRLLLPALVLLPILFYVGEWIGPNLMQKAERERALLLGSNQPTLRGQWYKVNQDYINIDLISSNTELIGVSRFVLDDQQALIRAEYSQRVTFEDDSWLLNDASVLEFTNSTVKNTFVTSNNWGNQFLSPELVTNLNQLPETLSISQLAKQVIFRSSAGTLEPQLERNFWNRIWFPIEYIALLLIALSFSFGSFRQKTVGDAAFKALVTGVVAGLLIDTFSTVLMIFNLPAFLSTAIANILFLSCAFFLLKRVY